MKLFISPDELTVCKVPSLSDVDLNATPLYIGHTPSELSVVCRTADAPSRTLAREDGWRALVVEGPLDFSLVGVLAELASVLAENRISIFALSTYDTDCVLVRAGDLDKAAEALRAEGHDVLPG